MHPVQSLLSLDDDAKVFLALANAKRLEILFLLEGQTLTATEIYEMLDLPQANSSQHLSILRQSNLISTVKKGRERHYTISDKRILHLLHVMRQIRLGDSAIQSTAARLDLHTLVPLAHDPVCGMKVSTKLSAFQYVHAQKQYFFCASGCLRRFKDNPEFFLNKQNAARSSGTARN